MERKKRVALIVFLSFTALAIALILAWLLTEGLHLFCPVKEFLHLRCPGCGNTRATLALLRFDLKAMLQFNLLYPLEMFYLARIYLSCAKKFIRNGRFCYHARPDWIDLACLLAILIWTVVRNVFAI